MFGLEKKTIVLVCLSVWAVMLSSSPSTVALAFGVVAPSTTTHTRSTATIRHMFGGAGATGLDDEDQEQDPEKLAKMEAEAKAMGMPLQEYQVGIKARNRLMSELTEARLEHGDAGKIQIIRDANNPPKSLEIVITQAGKDLGKDVVSQELCTQLKAASDAARDKRTQAQKDMMVFVGDEMKRLGISGPPGM